ncbi:MAG: tetratricopeptide repeat protein [Dehalococcoidia bacterium]
MTKSYPAEGVLADESPRVATTLTENLETAGSAAPSAETPAAPTPTESTQVEEPVAAESAVEEAPAAPEVHPEEIPVEAPAPVPAPSRPLLPQVVPTAVALTDRGIERLNEGRIQESIDQFTKALAMDPNYGVAWEKRAEALSQMGRDDEAEEDRLRLAAINAG